MSAALDHHPIPDAEETARAAEAANERPLRWTAGVLAVSALFLLVFNARSLSTWLADKEPTPVTLQARALAESWTTATAAVGLDRPHALVRALWERRKPQR
jgi:hypothetical protein